MAVTVTQNSPVVVDWDQIDTVMLDMDGTLLDLNFDNHFWHNHVPYCYACKHEMDIEQAREHLFSKYKNAEGTLDWYCVNYWTQQLGLDIAELKRGIAGRISIRPYVLEFLDQLQTMGKPLWLVTNAHRITLDIKMEKTQLGNYFQKLVCSHELNAAKEHPQFWQALQQRHPFDKQRSLFVDDSLSVLDAARHYGIKHCITISQPDSAAAAKDTGDYPAINYFNELLSV